MKSGGVKVHGSASGRTDQRGLDGVTPHPPLFLPLLPRRPIRRLALGVVLCDEVAQLLDDGVDELLSVSVRLPELSEDVVLPARLPHRLNQLLQQGQRRVRVDSQVFAGGFAVISQVGGPVPRREQVQELSQVTEGQKQRVTLEACDRAGSGKTLALLDVGVQLLQSAHGDLPDLRVQQELHQGGGDVFAGRHAGRLGHFTR